MNVENWYVVSLETTPFGGHPKNARQLVKNLIEYRRMKRATGHWQIIGREASIQEPLILALRKSK